MDVNKLLKNVNNLNQYITTTQDASNTCKNSKILLNMSSVLSLKKIRSFEIEYFDKCEENGIACVIFERMLSLPSSKTWGVLGKELVMLLQYWLDALRKHLVKRNPHWWTFLKLLLKYIKEIRVKDSSLPNILVEQTSECLLDLATIDRPDAIQRQEILHCLNMFCSESSREIRFAMRSKFGNYFVKLASYMATCGHLPCQYSILETLLRWLLPRQDKALRLSSAIKWFPHELYSKTVADIFMERSWLNFFQDARDLLNTHNAANDLITSVMCRRLAVSDFVIISGTEKLDAWLDINTPTRCMTVLLDPKVLESFGSSNHKTFGTLVISEENTQNAKLYREDQQLRISVTTVRPPQGLSTAISEDCRDVTIVVTSHCNLNRLDRALRKVFGDKYQSLLDVDKELLLSPTNEAEKMHQAQKPGEDSRFSHPVEVSRRTRSGYVAHVCQPAAWRSPSSASTSSLAQLHDKLAALPNFRYDKEPVSVCVQPELSVVAELSETDDKQSITLRRKHYGVYYKKNLPAANSSSRKSQSDTECKLRKTRQLSPVVRDDNAASCLLVATIGSNEDSVINDTVERLAKQKDYSAENIVDMLIKEAFASGRLDNEVIDSGINTGDKKTEICSGNTEAIDNTPYAELFCKSTKRKSSKLVESTSNDESNTESVIEATSEYVNMRRNCNKKAIDINIEENKAFDERAVEEFFSQHFTENQVHEIVMSPSLAKKINASSSDTSEDLDDHYISRNKSTKVNIDTLTFDNIDVIECLNNMVDRVCNEFERCTEYLNKETTTDTENPNEIIQNNIPLQDVINTIQEKATKMATPQKNSKTKQVKLKFKVTPKRNAVRPKTRGRQKKDKLESETVAKMSTIVEDVSMEEAIDINIENTDAVKVTATSTHENENSNVDDCINNVAESTTPMLRRKRKLYSPKDEHVEKPVRILETDDDDVALSTFKLKKTPKSKATCYKDIEKDRKKHIRMPRNRKSQINIEPSSPRTLKLNCIFDKLKESSEGEKVTLVDDTNKRDVYNFTSDSEDEDFKQKIDLRKRNSNTTVASVDSNISTRRGKRTNRIKDESKPKRKVTRRKNTRARANSPSDLVDERMREAKEVLETSIVVEKAADIPKDPPHLDPVLRDPPAMEMIDCEKPNIVPKKKITKKSKAADSKNINKKTINNKFQLQDDRTESPLPGLLVEQVPDNITDIDLSANMVDKLKKIYQEGPDNYVNESNTTHNLLSDIEKVNLSNTIEEIRDEPIEPKQTKDTKKRITRSASRSKKVLTQSRSSIEQISVVIEENSEISIATHGITAHGDDDEVPPKLLEETIQPRDIDDLDQSVKDYFNKLNNEINRSDSDSKEKNLDSRVPSEGSCKSLAVYLNKLSPEDISRWLPSRRNTDTDSSSVKSNINSASEKTRPKKISKSDDSEKAQSDKKISVRLNKIIQNAKHSNTTHNIISRNNSIDNDSVASEKPMTKTVKNKSVTNNLTRNFDKRASVISPIKLFDDLISHSDKTVMSLSDDEEYMSNIRNTLSNRARKTQNVKLAKSIDSTPSSKASTSTKKLQIVEDHVSLKTLKRTSIHEKVDVKKKRVEGNDVIELTSHSATVSSIDEWFKRNEPSTSREAASACMEDSVQNILERLDTTLSEIHQNTSRKFVHLFVEAQRHLSELKQVRRGIYMKAASSILSEVVKLVDQKFLDLDEKSQEMDDDFMKQLKERASELIRDDSKQKRLMVRLLREDVQAVQHHMDKRTGPREFQ